VSPFAFALWVLQQEICPCLRAFEGKPGLSSQGCVGDRSPSSAAPRAASPVDIAWARVRRQKARLGLLGDPRAAFLRIRAMAGTRCCEGCSLRTTRCTTTSFFSRSTTPCSKCTAVKNLPLVSCAPAHASTNTRCVQRASIESDAEQQLAGWGQILTTGPRPQYRTISDMLVAHRRHISRAPRVSISCRN
jgi:hypothetical protein